MKRWQMNLFTLLCVAVFMVIVGTHFYYRGVYDACVRASTVNNTVTLFDLISCRGLEQHARADNWFFMRSVTP